MNNRHYTHALTLQLPNVPAGYYPLGTEKTLRALYNGLAEGATTPVSAYELKQTPSFATCKIDEDLLLRRLRAIANGDLVVSLSSKDVVEKVAGVVLPARETLKGAGSLLQKFRNEGREKITVLDALPLIAVGQQAYSRARSLTEELTQAVDRTLYHDQTPDYIRNEKGIFVSQQWLDNRENARRVMTFKPVAKKLDGPNAG